MYAVAAADLSRQAGDGVGVARALTTVGLAAMYGGDYERAAEVLSQEIDFPYPDIIVARAAYLYAQSDPVMQPRVQTLEAQYKDLMYQVMERDERNTDSPYLNDFLLPVQAGLSTPVAHHWHPHADGR